MLGSACLWLAFFPNAAEEKAATTPNSYEAFVSSRRLSLAEWQGMMAKMKNAGLKTIHNPALQSRNMILIDRGNGAGVSAELKKELPALQAVPVKRSNGALIISTGRYFLRFSKEVSASQAKKRLLAAKFEILSEPGDLTPLFVVKRSQSPNDYESDLKELRRLPGVRTADMDDLILSKLP